MSWFHLQGSCFVSLTSDLPDYPGFSPSCGRVNSSGVYMGVVWYVLFLRAATSEDAAPGPGYEEQVVATVTLWGHAEDKRQKLIWKGEF